MDQLYFLQQWKLYKLLYIDQDNELINIFQKLILKNETIVYQKEYVPEYIIENPIVYSFVN
jgi:spore maturation protein CgeB